MGRGGAGRARSTWEYDDGRDRLLSLYQKGKDKQRDQVHRIDGDLEVEPHDVLGLPVETISIYGTEQWDRIKDDQAAIDELTTHLTSWQFSRIVPCVKDIGLFGDEVQKACADMGVLDMAGVDLNALMKQEEDIAAQIDTDKAELAASAVVVDRTIALGAEEQSAAE